MATDDRPNYVFYAPRPDDRQRIATLLARDMADLRVPKAAEQLLAVADLVLEDEGRSSYCELVRPKGGEAAGILLANILFSVKFAGKALWIENLFVHHSARRAGLGRLLVERMLDWAETNDIAGIDLEAYQGNTPAAILYRSLGFRRLSRERFWFDFGWVDQSIEMSELRRKGH